MSNLSMKGHELETFPALEFLFLSFLEGLWLRSCLRRKSLCKHAALLLAQGFQGEFWELLGGSDLCLGCSVTSRSKNLLSKRHCIILQKNNNNYNPKPHKKTLCCVIEHKIPLTVLGIPCGSVMCGCQVLACDAGLHCGSQNCWGGSVGLCLNEKLSFK